MKREASAMKHLSSSPRLERISVRLLQGLHTVSHAFRHYLKEILVALVLAIVAAVVIESYQKNLQAGILEQNLKAVACLDILDKQQRLVGQGSGVFVTPTGKLVTNYHVIKGAGDIRARLPSGAFYVLKGFWDTDEKADIAVLQFDATETPAVKGLGDSGALRVGEAVYAIGNPVSLCGTVSPGNVSNPSRRLDGQHFIQFTAPISPGSSGGGLFNSDGEVVGITAASQNIASGPQAGRAQNLNLAVPINSVKEVLTGGAASLQRESPELYYSRGNLADNKKHWDEAIKYYRKALALDETYADAYIGLGGDYYENGRFDLEVENYEKATIADPQNQDAFYLLALIRK
jgi:S1-C subfamily serine protease